MPTPEPLVVVTPQIEIQYSGKAGRMNNTNIAHSQEVRGGQETHRLVCRRSQGATPPVRLLTLQGRWDGPTFRRSIAWRLCDTRGETVVELFGGASHKPGSPFVGPMRKGERDCWSVLRAAMHASPLEESGAWTNLLIGREAELVQLVAAMRGEAARTRRSPLRPCVNAFQPFQTV